jgi:hypothetical protein
MASLAVLVCLYFPPSVSKFPRLLPFFFFYFVSSLSTLSQWLSSFQTSPPFSVSKEPSCPKNPAPPSLHLMVLRAVFIG